jgi:hypothetical protein
MGQHFQEGCLPLIRSDVAFYNFELGPQATLLYDFFVYSPKAPNGPGPSPIIEASRFHSDTPHSVGLLWTSDQPVAETST